ncbi:hypothetical protein BGX38DRAFT_1145344 [Terfezia claveryi]|nr:hypothetical protein BGX38DRAFT_1145344 [Terfezia claveryi]
MEVLDFPLACTLITHWFGFGRCRKLPPGLGATLTTEEGVPAPLNPSALGVQYQVNGVRRQSCVDRLHNVITAPYEILPRRLWDLKVNRVIPFYLFQLPWNADAQCFPEYVAISHSWVPDGELEYIYTHINQGAWAVPLPRGVDLELIRNEVLGHFPSSRYCWLDVLCLRQPWANESEHRPTRPTSLEKLLISLELGQDPTGGRHNDEIAVDVPTIGNVYKSAVGVLRYFNGLGRAFESTGWDSEHHWLNRTWTLQESTARMMNGGLLDPWMNPLNTTSMWRGTRARLREYLHEIEGSGGMPGINSSRSIIALAREMGLRRATNEVDKIAALSYLLHFEVLPLYSQKETVEQGWDRCLRSAPLSLLAELFFNCPCTGLLGLFPTWPELSDCTKAFVKQEIPCSLSISIMPMLSWPIEIEFFGYHLRANIKRAEQDGNCCLVVAQPKPEPRYPGMSLNLRFYPPHIEVGMLFTHSLTPSSSWVVLCGGWKMGVLCSDEHFGGIHRSQVLEKGSLFPRLSDERPSEARYPQAGVQGLSVFIQPLQPALPPFPPVHYLARANQTNLAPPFVT